MVSNGMTWDAAADRKLFLGVLKTQNISIDYEAMAKYMSTDSQTCTASAIQNRLKKLKAAAKSEGDVGSPGSADGNGTPKPKGKGGRKRTATAAADDMEESPIKKTKGKGGRASTRSPDCGDGEKEAEAEVGIKAEENADDDA